MKGKTLEKTNRLGDQACLGPFEAKKRKSLRNFDIFTEFKVSDVEISEVLPISISRIGGYGPQLSHALRISQIFQSLGAKSSKSENLSKKRQNWCREIILPMVACYFIGFLPVK